MTNNERFNQMLNQCKHPRQVYNMLAGGAPNIQKLCDYINQQPDPQLFMEVLLTVAAQRESPHQATTILCRGVMAWVSLFQL